jgi:hypothetical protein
MKLFLWDEIGCEISDREMPDLPLAGRHLIGAANGWLWAESDDSDPGYDAEHETTEDGRAGGRRAGGRRRVKRTRTACPVTRNPGDAKCQKLKS